MTPEQREYIHDRREGEQPKEGPPEPPEEPLPTLEQIADETALKIHRKLGRINPEWCMTFEEIIVAALNTRALPPEQPVNADTARLAILKDRIEYALSSDEVSGNIRTEFEDLLEIIVAALPPEPEPGESARCPICGKARDPDGLCSDCAETAGETPVERTPTYDELLAFVREIGKCIGTQELGFEYWKREYRALFFNTPQPERYS